MIKISWTLEIFADFIVSLGDGNNMVTKYGFQVGSGPFTPQYSPRGLQRISLLRTEQRNILIV